MKKIISMLLAAVMLLGLCACGASQSGSKGGSTHLQVGFGKEKMMPTSPVVLAGGETATRVHTGYLDNIYATCIAISDDAGETVLLITVDMQTMNSGFTGQSYVAITAATGVPKEKIFMAATHTHSAPAMDLSYTGVSEFQSVFVKACADAAKEAMEDLSPATVSAGQADAGGLIFARHYKTEDGGYRGSNYGRKYGAAVEHAYEGDQTLQIVRFNRAAEDKKDIIMMNAGVHATFNGSSTLTNLSADFPGPFRDYVEDNTDCLVAYFISAAGDQVGQSRLEQYDHGMDYIQYGEALGKAVVDGLSSLEEMGNDAIRFESRKFIAKTQKLRQDKAIEAKEVVDLYAKNPTEGLALAYQYDFESPMEARAILRQGGLQPEIGFDAHALTIGDVSIIFASYEMFGTNGRYIRENSPFEHTFVITCGDNHVGYVPDAMGYEMNCYEAYTAVCAKGTGEEFAQRFVNLLSEMKK